MTSARFPTYHAALCDAVSAGLAAGAAVRLRAGGSSMRPFLRDGEEVRIVPARASAIRPGDIVLVTTSRGAALHRAIAVNAAAGTLRTKGDGERGADETLFLGSLVGRADAVLRRGRWVALDTPGRRLLGRIVCTLLSPRESLRGAARRLSAWKARLPLPRSRGPLADRGLR